MSDAPGLFEGARGQAIYKNGEMGGGNEAHDPSYPSGAKAKGSQHVLNIGPAEFVESLGKVELE